VTTLTFYVIDLLAGTHPLRIQRSVQLNITGFDFIPMNFLTFGGAFGSCRIRIP
jgi:hypothetical protein